MISSFHPTSLFCTYEEWAELDFQDEFILNLTNHFSIIDSLHIDFALSSDFFMYIWENSPWKNDMYNYDKLIGIFTKLNSCSNLFDPPPNDECKISPKIKNGLSVDLNKYWLVLIHCLLHKQMETIVIIGQNVDEKMNSINVSCDCGSLGLEYLVIADPSDWKTKIDYFKFCPDTLDNWDDKFKRAIELCREQEFKSNPFKTTLTDINFSTSFKKDFLGIHDTNKKRKLIKKITKLLTLSHSEAGRDGGLYEEIIHEEYSVRISEGERIHYKETENIKTFLRYYPASDHDSRLR